MRQRNVQPGFTLIELLVVVSVIAVVVSIAILSLGTLGDDRLLQREAMRFESLLEVAQDEAVMQGREYGVEIMRESYRFVEYDPYQLSWTEIVSDKIFRTRQLPADVEFDLLLENKRVALKADAKDLPDPARKDRDAQRDRRDDYTPHILIYSSGESTPFELRFLNPDLEQAVILTGDLTGSMETMTEDEKADAML